MLEEAASLLDRAVRALLQGRFTSPPEAGVTVLLFSNRPAFRAYCA